MKNKERFFLKYCEKAQKNRPQAVIVVKIQCSILTIMVKYDIYYIRWRKFQLSGAPDWFLGLIT